jgi:WD40 repeat protein
MTSRSHRDQLFTSRTADQTNVQSFAQGGGFSGQQQQQRNPDFQPNAVNDSDPLQLEHMLGYAGDFRKTVLALPGSDQLYVKSMGSLVAIENMSDPHSQRFLRGHDMPISALAISESGRLIASGQVGTTHHKGCAAPVFLWHTETGSRITVLRGLTEFVSIVAFSPDERFICGSGGDGLLYIWDVATGEVAFGQHLSAPISILRWADSRKVGHNMTYDIVFGMNSTLVQGYFTYDNFRMQWSLPTKTFATPPGRTLVRQFHSIDLSRDGQFVFVGTSSGEMMVFRRDSVVFRACIPVCTNGLQELVTLPDDTVVCGGGDGTFTKLYGRDLTWQKVQDQRLDHSMVKSMSLIGDGRNILVSCASGAVYRCATDNLQPSLLNVSNTSAVTCIAFPVTSYPPSSSVIYYFATGTKSGEIRMWDLTDYACVAALKVPKAGSVLCLVMPEVDKVLSGWQDGSVRCSDSAGRQLWYLPTAHRDGTTAIAAHIDASMQYFVTGGGDGAIRVWRYANRELITQYTEHRQGVGRVLVDNQQSNIVHSIGGDASVLSFDLKAGRRIVSHIVNTGTMHTMTQRTKREYELVTGDSMGRLLHWDIDVRDPVLAVQDPSRYSVRACQISPSGRFIAFAGDDEYVKVLDDETNTIISLGQSHSGPVLCLTWTPDERQIISGGEDTCLSVWNFFLGGEK